MYNFATSEPSASSRFITAQLRGFKKVSRSRVNKWDGNDDSIPFSKEGILDILMPGNKSPVLASETLARSEAGLKYLQGSSGKNPV